MYSTKINIGQLTSLMIQHGIKEIVISPGSRNMPLAETFAHCSSFNCHPVTDERSAGFFALGIAQQKGEAVAVCVTSGSALLNLASAVSEAYYQQIPLLVISADRPQAWIGQMDGQTLPQTGVFGSLIKYSAALCEPQNETDRWHNNRMINEAMIALRLHQPGPVHINVPITEPFFDCSATELPNERKIELVEEPAQLKHAWETAQSPIVIVGQLPKHIADKIEPFLAKLNVPVLCESLANLEDDSFVRQFDVALISEDHRNHLRPDLVLYLGGHVISKRLKKWLRAVHPESVWRLSPEGAIADTFQSLTHVIKYDLREFLKSLAENTSVSHEAYRNDWLRVDKSIQEKFKLPEQFVSMRVAFDFCQQIPTNSTLVLANSSSVRYAQLAKLPHRVTVCCNRGVNGIDGSLSAAVGIAAAEASHPVFLLIGDLSFFYDMNALWNVQLPANLHILLINNGCGEIFRTLPGLSDTGTSRQYVMASHQTTAKGWVESMKCTYFEAYNWEDYQSSLNSMIHASNGPSVLEVFTDAFEDELAHKTFYSQFE